MEDRIPDELIARIRKFVPKGKITTIPMEPLKGEVLQPMTWDDVRASAPKTEKTPAKKKRAA